MISKRIGIAPQNDNYARLANYVADAGDKGEKLLLRWSAGCAEEGYAEGIAEVVETQDLNTRTAQCKTYHLIVSFRPQDESKLAPEAFREIEERFAGVLGLAEHQRHCAVHKNTGNLHLHIAYNLIHPERLTMMEPFRDYHKRDQGSELFYSSEHEAAKKTALLYAQAKWGKAVALDGNRIARKPEPAKDQVKGMER